MSPFIYYILLRFLIHKIAITEDIEGAFLNVSVDPRVRDYLSFLWFNDDVTDRHPNIQVCRMEELSLVSPLVLTC